MELHGTYGTKLVLSSCLALETVFMRDDGKK